MAVARRNKIDERKLQGVRQLEKLLPLVERLHGVGCERDTAGNRQLFMDQYCLLILLYFFNPIVTSLRGIPLHASDGRQQHPFHGRSTFRLGRLHKQ